MRPDDAAAVAELSTQLGYASTGAEMERRIAALLGREDHALLVATMDGEWVVGWVHVCAVACWSWIRGPRSGAWSSTRWSAAGASGGG